MRKKGGLTRRNSSSSLLNFLLGFVLFSPISWLIASGVLSRELKLIISYQYSVLGSKLGLPERWQFEFQ
jgi:hypothetical protein